MNEPKPAYEIIFNNAVPFSEYNGTLKGKLVIIKDGIYYVVDPNDVTNIKCE